MDKAIIEAARTAGNRTGVPAAALLAIAKVESGLKAFALVEGRREPLIRFEGHWFDRLLAGADRETARKAGLASPKAGAVRNPVSQAARWDLLRKAAAIDADAAYAATSWGVGQVMGFHWKRLGFASATALADEARRSVEGQLLLVARYLKLGDLDRLLAGRRFADFAKSYNGPGFAANRYDAKIAAAFEEAEQAVAAADPLASPPPASALGQGKSRLSGWAGSLLRLSAALRWTTNPQPLMPTSMRFFWTSTERSSDSPATPPASR